MLFGNSNKKSVLGLKGPSLFAQQGLEIHSTHLGVRVRIDYSFLPHGVLAGSSHVGLEL